MSGHRSMAESTAALLDELLTLVNVDTCKGRSSKERTARQHRIIKEILLRTHATVTDEVVEEIWSGNYRWNQRKREEENRGGQATQQNREAGATPTHSPAP